MLSKCSLSLNSTTVLSTVPTNMVARPLRHRQALFDEGLVVLSSLQGLEKLSLRGSDSLHGGGLKALSSNTKLMVMHIVSPTFFKGSSARAVLQFLKLLCWSCTLHHS